MVYDVLEAYGLDMSSANFDKDFHFTSEAIRAMIYRCVEADHFLHEFIDNNVNLVSAEELANKD